MNPHCFGDKSSSFLVWCDFYLKNNRIKFFFKKTAIGTNQLVSIRFGYFRTKTKTQPAISVRFGLVWFWFSFGSIQLFYIKTKKNYIVFWGFFCNF